jgi:threonyl-tRNA synthetase
MDDLDLSHRVSYRISLRDASKDKFIPDDEGWEFAESTLRSIVEEAGIEYEESPGDAAHYGPKLDIEIENSQGKQETLFTNQLDFALQKRFDLQYVDRDGSRKTPYVIHRSSIGCVERTMALLIEEYEGAFPLWLAPVQATVLPVGSDVGDYARRVAAHLSERGLRVEIDDSDEPIGKRLHTVKRDLVPYACIVGPREVESGTVTVKSRDTGAQETIPLEAVVDALVLETSSRERRATLCR